MKSYVTSIAISCSVLAASVSLAAAPDAQPPQRAIVVAAGNDLRCRLEKGLRITKSGEPITAKLVDPVYAGTTIAIPEGSTIKGHVSSISSTPRRKGQILRGDFTRPRTAQVTFDKAGTPAPYKSIQMSDISRQRCLLPCNSLESGKNRGEGLLPAIEPRVDPVENGERKITTNSIHITDRQSRRRQQQCFRNIAPGRFELVVVGRTRGIAIRTSVTVLYSHPTT